MFDYKVWAGHINRGLDYFENNDFDNAISEFSEAIMLSMDIGASKKESCISYSYRGVAYACKGDYGQAVENYASVVDYPNFCPNFTEENLNIRELLERVRREGDPTSKVRAEMHLGLR